MKKLKINHIKLCPIIGLGYWKDVYSKESIGIDGVAHNVIMPFVRIQWGYLISEQKQSPPRGERRP